MLVFGKYLLVGVVNTFIGFGFIFCLYFWGLGQSWQIFWDTASVLPALIF